MKEETKNVLKKFGKVTAYGFGLFAMLLLGVGLGNCSARDKSVKANAETGQTLADYKTLRPKRALDPDEWYNLGDNPDNLLLNGTAGRYTLARYDADDVGGYRLNDTSTYFMYLCHLGAGAFVFEHSASVDSWVGQYCFVSDHGASEVQKRFNGEPSQRVLLEDTDIENARLISINNGVSAPRTIVNCSSSFPWIVLFASVQSSLEISLSVYDPLSAPAVASFDFPVIFNPYPLGGSPAVGDYIFNGPAVSEGTITQSQTLYFNGLSFRSNGKYYNRIILTYKHDINQPFGHYDASGNFVIDGTLGSKAWFFDYMIYSDGTSSDVVWNAKFENVDSNLAWKPALVSGGLWVAQEYRHIEVLSFSGSTLSGLPASSLVANSSVESVLKLISSYVAPSTSEMGNPFTLIREGFSAVGGILQIQILPFMTLGTLIFVPLVVLVILAILKLLAK